MVPLMLMVACAPEPDEGSLYHRYSDRKGLTVAEIDGFPLCDSVRIDVVMLQAETADEWLSWLGTTDNPAQRTEWNGTAVMRVVASHGRHTIGIYRIDNEVQYDALIDYQLNNMD